MGGMDLDPVEAGPPRPLGRLTVSPHRVFDVGLRHLAAARLLGAAFLRRGEGRQPRQLRGRQDAAVCQLQDDPAAVVMDGLRHPGKPGDALVSVDTQLSPQGKPFGPDIGVARDDEPHAACGKLPHETNEFFRASAVGRRKAFPGGGADKPVTDAQGTDACRVKENGITHAPPPVLVAGSPVDKAALNRYGGKGACSRFSPPSFLSHRGTAVKESPETVIACKEATAWTFRASRTKKRTPWGSSRSTARRGKTPCPSPCPRR